MGVVNIGFVPAAILHMNPGITKYEFMNLLNNVRHNFFNKIKTDLDEPLTIDLESSEFHHGIFGLASILGLNNPALTIGSRADLSQLEPSHSKTLIVQARPGKTKWLTPKFIVRDGIEEIIELEVKHEQKRFGKKPSVNEIYTFVNDGEIKIKKIHSLSKDNLTKLFIVDMDYEKIRYKNILKEFDSLKKLVNSYPEFDPKKCISWNTPEGIFLIPQAFHSEDLIWEKTNNKYYLKTNNIKEHNYTSIIVTCEAIKKKKWGLFQFHGYYLTNKFLFENKKSLLIHQNAINDYWISDYAKKTNMSNSDLLRYRMVNGFSNIKHQKISDQHVLNIVMADLHKSGKILYHAPRIEDLIKPPTNELPF